MKILLANPRGFCAGVKRAIKVVEDALKIYGAPIYVRHEVVHNRYIVTNFQKKGVIFVEEISAVPDNSVLIFSAHGVSKNIRKEVEKRKIKMLIDATCPLVSKVHMEVSRASNKNMETIFIGYAEHPEAEGTLGQYTSLTGGIYLVESVTDVFKLKIKNENNLCYMTQTTLSVEDTNVIIHALRQRFPKIIGPYKNDICYATINRQTAVKNLAKKSDLILVIGSKNSSNSKRLYELAKRIGKKAKLIDSTEDIQNKWFNKVKYVGITSGASAPEILVRNIIDYLYKYIGCTSITEVPGQKEKIIFHAPKMYNIK